MTGPYDPIIAVPTTAGTGSEVGRSSVITSHELGRKIIIFSPWLMPKRAILDPELTVSLPPFLTAATGMDAFTHCLESLTCPSFHPLCDAIAIHGLELVIRYLERATRDGKRYRSARKYAGRGGHGSHRVPEGSRRHALAGPSALHGVWRSSRAGECVVPARR